MIKKCASQTAPQRSWKNAILLTLGALALCAFPAAAPAVPCTFPAAWIGSTGSWFDSRNWGNGRVPDSDTSAYINNGTADINSTGAQACELFLGFYAANSGKVSINGGSLAVTTELEVGAFGKGTLSITNGATVSAGLLTIAALDPSSSGSVSVDGATVTIATRADVGGDNGNTGGIGLMTIKNGGTVTVSAGYLRVYKSGTLTGNGTLSASSGTSIEGTLTPKGQLTISSGNLTIANGGTLVCGVTQQAWDNVNVVSGTATIDTANSKLIVTMTGSFTPGDFRLLSAPHGLFGSFLSVSITYSSGCLSPSIRYNYDDGYVYLHVESSCQ